MCLECQGYECTETRESLRTNPLFRDEQTDSEKGNGLLKTWQLGQFPFILKLLLASGCAVSLPLEVHFCCLDFMVNNAAAVSNFIQIMPE